MLYGDNISKLYYNHLFRNGGRKTKLLERFIKILKNNTQVTVYFYM